MKNETIRQDTKKEQIINILRERPNGITNVELSKVALRYGGYLGLLYRDGYKITKAHLGDGVYLYTLTEEPKEKRQHSTAIETFACALQLNGMDDVASSLVELLEEAGVALRFKGGTYQ